MLPTDTKGNHQFCIPYAYQLFTFKAHKHTKRLVPYLCEGKLVAVKLYYRSTFYRCLRLTLRPVR